MLRGSADRESADREKRGRTLTRLGACGPGADLSCLRQVSAPGPTSRGYREKVFLR